MEHLSIDDIRAVQYKETKLGKTNFKKCTICSKENWKRHMTNDYTNNYFCDKEEKVAFEMFYCHKYSTKAVVIKKIQEYTRTVYNNEAMNESKILRLYEFLKNHLQEEWTTPENQEIIKQMKINSITDKYNYQNYDAIEEYYREETLYSEDESTYEVMETSLNQALEASFQEGQGKKDYPIDTTRTNAMMITEK
ncbi:1798_t:CDS:1 [Dentiscutata heterogama]|uniref:1798_t:CDS:1 n=1 Tax=Dentiscutata heterogama TaxID=1316150 RepID=A0ACA9NVP5_9GLOM|nr:1798_t:CDS:1 [Dentiscutata heterogama]